MDVTALVIALGEGEAEAAFVRLHQGDVEFHFLQKPQGMSKVIGKAWLSMKYLSSVPSYRDKVLHVLAIAGHGEVQGQR